MSQNLITPTDIIQQILQAQSMGIKTAINMIYSIVKILLPSIWPYLLIFFAIILSGVIFQIIMLRGGTRNRLSPGFNRLIGSLTYLFFFCLMLTLSYLIWGTLVIDEIWFIIFGLISYPVTKLFLRKIGFWYY